MAENNGMVPVLVPPQFAKFMAEFFGDKRNVLWPVANISKLPLPLTTAQTSVEKEIEGDFIYADSDSTGVIYVRINNPAMPEIPVRPNFGIYGFPIKRIFVRWDAQAGKQINLLYGYGAQIIPPNQDITSIGSITSTVPVYNLSPFAPGFLVDRQRVAGGAGQFGIIQLWNPVGSGINLYLDRIHSDPPGALMSMVLYDATVATGSAWPGTNKNLGGAVSIGESRSGLAAGAFGTRMDIKAMNATGQGEEWIFKDPIIIPPNRGLSAVAGTANTAVSVSFEWREG